MLLVVNEGDLDRILKNTQLSCMDVAFFAEINLPAVFLRWLNE